MARGGNGERMMASLSLSARRTKRLHANRRVAMKEIHPASGVRVASAMSSPSRLLLCALLVAPMALTVSSCSRTDLGLGVDVSGLDASVESGCRSCADLGATCGAADDGCGNTLACGHCSLPETCGVGGANKCGCTPSTCTALHAECGETLDGCDGVLACGTCPTGEICGGAGANRCGRAPCTPKTCGELGVACGKISDGCSRVIDCGGCASPDTCGGGGALNQCGCTAYSCKEIGAACGAVSNGCGKTLECGACTPPTSCGVGGTNKCGCVPVTCAAIDAHCGTMIDGCGGTLDCGTCNGGRGRGGGKVCLGTGPANCSEEGEHCTPTTCARIGARCGSAADGCGGLLDCGACTAPESCGAGGVVNQCGCMKTTCDARGAACGSAADGCGGMLDCGGCALGKVCFSNACGPMR